MNSSLTSFDSDELIGVAHQLADAARVETLAHFRSNALGLENKLEGGFDPVTVADRASERAMRDLLGRLRPDDAILGEEFGQKPGTTGLTWVLDPIDGTRGYMSGTPTWGVLVSVSDATGPIFGLIDQPYIGERFAGGFGVAEYTGPHFTRKLAVRDTQTLSEAVIFSTFPEVGSDIEARAFHEVAGACKLTRYGMDCYAYALLAAGQIDLVIEAGLAHYDVQAPIAVVQAAGGIMTDWQGRPVRDGGRVVAAATPALHDAALAVLSKAPDA
ncbi:MAG: inositol monophosphatase family protein [Brevirhabdus sp.]